MEIIYPMSEIKKGLNTDVNQLLKDFLSKTTTDHYVHYYTGKVLDNKDPNQLGRCKIQVYGVYDNIPEEDIPWALPDQTFVGSLMGNFVCPPINAIVKVYFDGGDIYLPRYTGKVVEQSNLPSDRTTDYPDTMVLFETDNGTKLTINRKKKDIKLTHANGTVISIDGITGEYKVEHESGSSIIMDTAGNIKIDHKLFLEDTGIAVIPTGQGPFCALPTCPYGGFPIQGQRVAPGTP